MKFQNKHFKLFQKECQKWIDIFGLKGWTIYYSFENLENTFAECRCSYRGRVATLVLSKNGYSYKEHLTAEQSVKKSALHECLELLLSPLGDIAEDRTWCAAEYEKEKHCVIRTFENLLLEQKG